MLRRRRLCFLLFTAMALCAVVWQSARMQSPLRRITNTTEEGISLNPSISGDGRIVGFESTEDVAGAGGSESFRALRANVSVDPATFMQMGATRAPAPAVSQDGSRIAFASKDNPLGTNSDANSEIFLYDGARLIQVTNTSPGDISNRTTNGNFSPSISDDGRYIAFSSNRNLTNQNADGNLEIFVYDTIASSFTQATNSSGIVGFSDAKISGDGTTLAYIRDTGQTAGTNRDLVRQNRQTLVLLGLPTTNTPALALTYGRAISDDGLRVVWSTQTATSTTQVFLFDGRNGNTTRQITALGSRATDVPLHPTISGDGSRIAFATRRAVPGQGSNSDTGVELYTYDIPSGTFGRVTNLTTAGATADVVSSMNDDGSVIAFSFPRLLSGPVSNDLFQNNSEIYLSGTPARPTSGALTILNRASFGHEPSTIKAVAPDSIAVALGGALAFTTQQSQPQADGSFPTTVAGTTVSVNGQPAQIFFVSPTEVHFHVPATTLLGTADVVVTNSDGFQSRGNVTTLLSAPGIFTNSGDGLGDGMILNADTLQPGPFDPSNGNLRLIVFATGVRNAGSVTATAGGRSLTVESIMATSNMPGMDEVHVLVPADLRGVGKVDLVIRGDGRDSNPATVEFSGDARRDVLINEFLADPPDGLAGDANHDGARDASQDEFIELVNTTTHDIDISGYRLSTRGTGSDTLRHVFAAGRILPACSAIVVFGGGNASFNPNDPAFGGAQVVTASTGGLSLVNGGGVITLVDQASTIVNLVTYGSSGGVAADNNQSVTRSPDITGSFAQHLSASGGARAFSPGTQINGAPFNACTPAVSRIEVSPTSATIDADAQQQFTARAFDSGNNEIPGVIFTWQSSNTNVATIDQSGLATGASAGMTQIIASGRGVASSPAALTVLPAAPKPVAISQVYGGGGNSGATFKNDFIEVFNRGATTVDISRWSVQYVSATSTSGSFAVTNLCSSTVAGTCTLAPGQYYLVKLGSGGGGTTDLPSADATGTTDMAATAGKVALVNSRTALSAVGCPTTGVVDFVGYGTTANCFEGSGRAPAPGNTTADLRKVSGCQDTDDNAADLVSGAPNPRNSGSPLNNCSGPPTPTPTPTPSVTPTPTPTPSPGPTPLIVISQVYGGGGNSGATLKNDFVEVFNHSEMTADISSWSVQYSSATSTSGSFAVTNLCSSTVAGTCTLAPGQYYLVKLGSGGGGTTDLPPADATGTTDMAATAGKVALVNSRTALSAVGCPTAGVVDFVGYGTTANCFEGSGRVPAPSNTTSDLRKSNGCQDTDDNAADFVSGVPNPRNSSSPLNDCGATDLAISKTGTPDPVIIGSDVTYTITVNNNGPATAQSVLVTDNLPGSVTFVSCNATNGGVCGGSGNNRTVSFSSLANGASGTITLVATANGPAGTSISNTATVDSATPDSNNANNSATAMTSVQSPQPGLSIDDVTANEGNSGTTTFSFTVSLAAPAPATVTFDIATQDNTATAASSDYVARSLTNQSIPTGQQTYTFDVMVNGDTLVEPDETFFVNVTNVSGASVSDGQGLGTIKNDDTANLVISQVFGGGGNTGAQYTNDFVGLFNRGTTTVNFATTPYSVQYAGATASFGSSKVDLTSGTMAPGQYFLIQLSSGGAVGAPLPAPDATGSIAMAATAGKVALVAGTTALTGSGCPLSPGVADFVGYGTTADCFEGSGRAAAPGNSTADFRKNGGCTDTNDNAADFLVAAPFPRNTSSPINNCTAGTTPGLSINDVTIVEGNSGTTTATFTVSLSAPAPSTDVTFNIATQDGSATTANSDYMARSLTNQVIPAGQQTYTFAVTINGDTNVEPDETFLVNVTSVVGATVVRGQGVGTIQNDDLPSLSINDVSQNEGNLGPTTFTFTVSLSAPAPATVTFDIATQDNTATIADNDYVARSLTGQTIAAGSSTYTFDVTVNGDTNIEPNETFFVNVTNVAGATVADGQGLGTILNDDSPTLSIDNVSANEGNSGTSTFSFTVSSSLPAPVGGITFDIATQDNTATAASGDYVARSLTNQMIPAGQQMYTFDVTVNGDTLVEPDETFFVHVTSANGNPQGIGTIQNDDVALLVISQIYGGGNNAGATFQNDFVELFNRGTSTVNFATTPYSVQYASASGTFSSGNTVSLTSGSLVPGQYFLIELAGGTTNGAALPPADATNTAINMSATDGKVALVAGTTVLTGGGCPISANVADFIGYGSANCAETTATAVLSATKSARRTSSCVDSDNNSADFTVVTNPTAPRNSTSPLNNCNALPDLSIDDVSVMEGNSGTVLANFTVSLSAPAPAGGVTFDIATQDNTATTADNDYVARSLTAQTIAAGGQTYSFAVTVNGDTNVEPDEAFFVNVTNVTGANVIDGQGIGTITNDDSAPLPNLTIDDVSLAEGNSGPTTFTFTVNLSAPAPAGGVTFDIATADGTAQDHNPPTEDNDYVPKALTAQTIAAGNTSYMFSVTVNGDTVVEGDETFAVNVTNLTGANLADGTGQGTIQNDDTANLVISQVYGGGGNTSATYTNDFIEIFNRGTTTVDFSVTPYSLQYAGATSNFSTNKTDITSGTLLPGHYFLVQEGSGGAVGVGLPMPDATGTINLSATAGKVALVSGTTALTGSGCPLVASVVDFLGYGSTANCSETSPIAVSGTNSNARSVIRTVSCTDSNNNSADFSNPTTAPVARNTATTAAPCP